MQTQWDVVLTYMSHHPRWFEGFGRRAMTGEHLGAYREVVPNNWQLRRRGYWMVSEPPQTPAIAQGWKLHVSATSATSVETLRRALPVLRDARVHFKFLMDPDAVREANGKSYGRGSSGKFITVYPRDEAEFHAVGSALTAALAGLDGPYILSDRRFPGSRVVFYRYGGFAAITRLQPNGVPELLIHDADGQPVPDRRNPYFSSPVAVADPFTGELLGPPTAAEDDDAQEAPEAAPLAGRFTVTGVLAFSNRGGIYRGVDTETGADVLLREARPGVEVGRGGIDAVELLRHEYTLLTRLADTGLFVRPIAFFTAWEHAFLVEEFVEGTHLGHLSISQNPVYSLDLTPDGLTRYYQRFQRMWLQVADAIAVCHERGIVLGDISPTNIMVTPDDEIRVIDLESAFYEDPARQTGSAGRGAGLFTPGMVTRRAATAGRGDRRTDYYALGGLLLVCVHLCHQGDNLDPAMPRAIFQQAAADLDLPAELVSLITELYDEDPALPDPAELRRRIEELPFGTAWKQPPPLARPAVRDPQRVRELHSRVGATLDGVVDYLRGTADPTRSDRLYPADPMVFETNPLSLAHGAYGCLYALHTMGREVPRTALGWALQQPTTRSKMPPGLYYGTAGVAWAQSVLGLADLAVTTLRTAGDHPLLYAEPGVTAGAAGHGMACLRLWRDTALPEFLDRARAIGQWLAKTARRDGADGELASWELESGRRPVGYAEGAAGIAMFLLALHAACGEPDLLELGSAALRFDLAQAETAPSGLLSFPAEVAADGEPSSVLRQYWDEGSAGVLTTALRYHAVTGDPGLLERIRAVLPDVRRPYAVFPQLFHGLSGLGSAVLDAYEYLGEPELLADAEHIADTVLCYAVRRPEGVVFPGEQCLRESCDLATGSAGVALFLDRLATTRPGARTNRNFLLDDLVDELALSRAAGAPEAAGPR